MKHKEFELIISGLRAGGYCLVKFSDVINKPWNYRKLIMYKVRVKDGSIIGGYATDGARLNIIPETYDVKKNKESNLSVNIYLEIIDS